MIGVPGWAATSSIEPRMIPCRQIHGSSAKAVPRTPAFQRAGNSGVQSLEVHESNDPDM